MKYFSKYEEKFAVYTPILVKFSQFPDKTSGQYYHKRKLLNHHLQGEIEQFGNKRVQNSTPTEKIGS